MLNILCSCVHYTTNVPIISNNNDLFQNNNKVYKEIELKKSKLDTVNGQCGYNSIEDTMIHDRLRNIFIQYCYNMETFEKYFDKIKNIPDTLKVLYSKNMNDVLNDIRNYKCSMCKYNILTYETFFCAEYIKDNILGLRIDHYLEQCQKYQINNNYYHNEVLRVDTIISIK